MEKLIKAVSLIICTVSIICAAKKIIGALIASVAAYKTVYICKKI